MKKLIPLIVIAVVAILLAVLLWPKNHPAASFSLNNLNGKPVSNAALPGKVTLINFWYPSCPGCVSEMPKIIKTAKDYAGKDFQVIGIAEPYDSLESVKNYVAERGISFTIAYDQNGQSGKAFGTQVYPTSFLINKQGEVLKTFVGEPDFAQLYQQIDQELAK